MKQANPADFFSKKKKLFEVQTVKEETKIEEKADKNVKVEATNSFEKEVEAAIRNFITNELHRLAVDYAAKHHEHGVTVSALIKRGIAEMKREIDASK